MEEIGPTQDSRGSGRSVPRVHFRVLASGPGPLIRVTEVPAGSAMKVREITASCRTLRLFLARTPKLILRRRTSCPCLMRKDIRVCRTCAPTLLCRSWRPQLTPSRALSPEISAQAEGPADAICTGSTFDIWKRKVIEGGKLVRTKSSRVPSHGRASSPRFEKS